MIFHVFQFNAVLPCVNDESHTVVCDHATRDNAVIEIVEEYSLTKKEKLNAIKSILAFHSLIDVGQLSFSDYPEAAVLNARKALEYKTANPDSACGNNVLWSRCKQIANKQPLSYSN